MFYCPVGIWVIEQRTMILSATVRSPTVHHIWSNFVIALRLSELAESRAYSRDALQNWDAGVHKNEK